MPELPELEIARRQLARWSEGRVLRAATPVDGAVVRRALSSKPSDAVPDAEAALAPLLGRRVSEVRRHGKRIAAILGDAALCAHFGMTGYLVRRLGAPPPASARLALTFGPGPGGADEPTVWLVDGRRFGCVHVVAAEEADAVLRDGQGADAWTEPPTGGALRRVLKGKKPVKPALMEQDRLAGLGNIHAAEACFRAGVSPATPCADLTDGQLDALAAAITAQLAFAIAEGDTDDDVAYVNLGGPNPFSVYGREGEACRACGTAIRAEEQAGRTTFWCPTCQPTRAA